MMGKFYLLDCINNLFNISYEQNKKLDCVKNFRRIWSSGNRSIIGDRCKFLNNAIHFHILIIRFN